MGFSNDIQFGSTIGTPMPDVSEGAQFRNASVNERDRDAFRRALEKREDQNKNTSNNETKNETRPASQNTQNKVSNLVQKGEAMNNTNSLFTTTNEPKYTSTPVLGEVSKNGVKGEYANAMNESEQSELMKMQGMPSEVKETKREPSEAQPKAGIESLFSQMHSPVDTLTSPKEVNSTSTPAQPIDAEKLESLVSKILVSSPEKGSTEVRLMLEDSVLKGTEISLVRDATGALQVKIFCTDPQTFQTLVASRNDLLEKLNSNEKSPVEVQMNETKAGEQGSGGEGDSKRRSEGLVKDEYGNYI